MRHIIVAERVISGIKPSAGAGIGNCCDCAGSVWIPASLLLEAKTCPVLCLQDFLKRGEAGTLRDLQPINDEQRRAIAAEQRTVRQISPADESCYLRGY